MKKFLVALMLCFVSIVSFATEETTCIMNDINGDFSRAVPSSYIVRTDDAGTYTASIIKLPDYWANDIDFAIGQINTFVNSNYQTNILIPFQYNQEHDNYNAAWESGEYRMYAIYYYKQNMLVLALGRGDTEF